MLNEPVRAVVECTSNWYWLSDWCRDNDIDLTLAYSKMAGAISYGKVKTDKVDAKTLAELLRADLIPEAHQVTPKRRELRELTRGRLRMIQWRQLGKLQEWLQPQLPPAASLQAKLLIAQIRQLQGHIHRIEQEIDRQTTFNQQVQRLLEVPGLGLVGAWTILAEIGDIGRFPSAKQFVSYCRLVPGAKDSGSNHRHKSGNKVVKKFYRKIKRRSGRSVARAIVGKKLAKGVWHMLTKDEEYKGFKGQPVRAASQTFPTAVGTIGRLAG